MEHCRIGGSVGDDTDLIKNLDGLDDLWKGCWSQIYDTNYRAYLQTEILNHPDYSKHWQVAKDHLWWCNFRSWFGYGSFQQTVSNKFGKAFPADDFHIAVVAYTLNYIEGTSKRLFEDFNNKARTLTLETWKDFPFKSLWYLLGFSVPQLKNVLLPENVILYRGLHDFQYPDDALKQAIRTRAPVVLGTSFASTSPKKELATNFAGKLGCKNCTHKKCLLTFSGRPNFGNSITKHSWYPTEGEVLVCPWSQWIVTGVSYHGDWQEITLEPNRNQHHR